MTARKDPDSLKTPPLPKHWPSTVKSAMLHDWGSRDAAFIAMNRQLLQRLTALANAEDSHVCVPVQGSGTFAVEATIGTLLPRQGKLLVLVNGAYGQRMVRIAEVIGRAVAKLEWPENEPVEAAAVTVT